MKFLKNNIFTILALTLLICVVLVEPANADTVFQTARKKAVDLFKNSKLVLFVLGGFGLMALAFQAIFGKLKWAWFATLAFGLAVVAAAGSVVKYATDDTNVENLGDTLSAN